jgi:hypothetical protein
MSWAVALITNVSHSQALSGDHAAGLIRVLSDYTYAQEVLDKYENFCL